MLTTLNVKKMFKLVAISWMVGVGIAGVAQTAGAGFTLSAAKLQSTRPCLFSEQLQESALVRKQFTAKLAAVLGGTVLVSSPVEEMYGNITPASYREGDNVQTEPTVNIWGFEVKQSAPTTGIDTLSADCLSCHDGVAALQVTTVLKNNPFGSSHRALPGNDHPIGMNYDSYAAASKEYKPLFGASNKMVFVDGKVGCLTCHDPLNSEKGHLVMSDMNSALCLTCHNK